MLINHSLRRLIVSDDAAMFPYGPQAGDKAVTDTQNANDLQLDVPREGVVFYGRRHGYIAVRIRY